MIHSISNMMLQHAARSNIVFGAPARHCCKAEIWAVKKVAR